MSNDIKATVVFVCGLNPHPVTKLESVRSTRAGTAFVPSVCGKARLPDNVREYEVDFPIAVADVDSLEKFESLRQAFHARVDASFEAYLKRWEEVSKAVESREKKPMRTVVEALKEVKNKEPEEGSESGASGVDVGD